MEKVECRLFKIPPRSQDLNPIENVFRLIGKKFREDIVSRNKTIELMPRIESIKCQGQKTKY